MDRIVFDEPIIVLKDDRFLKTIIMENGRSIYKIIPSELQKALERFDCGFVILGRKENTNVNKRISTNSIILKAFTLFEFDFKDTILRSKIIFGYESCKGNGLILLKRIRRFCQEHNIYEWHLNSLPYERLISFYEKFGFTRGRTIYIKGEPKVIQMYMIIDFNKNYDDTETDIEESEHDQICG